MGGLLNLASMPIDSLLNSSIAGLGKLQLIGFDLVCNKEDIYMSALV